MPRRDDAPDRVLLDVASRIVEHFETTPGGTPPCWVYVYDPKEEYGVRRDLRGMQTWLSAPGRDVRCVPVSLAQLVWEALDESGMYDELVAQERAVDGDADAQSEIHRAVGQILRLPPSLTARVAAILLDSPGRRAAILYRAGGLYPGYRTSALLDDLRLRAGIRLPVLLCYPGTIEGDYGLRFMGTTEPAYGYRAMIVRRHEAGASA